MRARRLVPPIVGTAASGWAAVLPAVFGGSVSLPAIVIVFVLFCGASYVGEYVLEKNSPEESQ